MAMEDFYRVRSNNNPRTSPRKRGMNESERDICRQIRHILKQYQDSQTMETDGGKGDVINDLAPDVNEMAPDVNKWTPDIDKLAPEMMKKSCWRCDDMKKLAGIGNKYNIPLSRQVVE